MLKITFHQKKKLTFKLCYYSKRGTTFQYTAKQVPSLFSSLAGSENSSVCACQYYWYKRDSDVSNFFLVLTGFFC